MDLHDIKTWATILSILVSIAALIKSIVDRSKARSAIAVSDALQKKRVDDLETSVTNLKAELNGVKTGFDAGIGKLQESMHGIGELLSGLQTKVAILIDRDEREKQRNLAAAQQAAQFAAQRPTRATKPRV